MSFGNEVQRTRRLMNVILHDIANEYERYVEIEIWT
jgi:hypothetical protein